MELVPVRQGSYVKKKSDRRMPGAAHRNGPDPVQLKTLEPRALLVSYAGLILKEDAAERDLHLPDRRLHAQVSAFELGSVSVGKTYRHPLAGGSTSRFAAVCQQHDVGESEFFHVFDRSVIELYLHAHSIAQGKEIG